MRHRHLLWSNPPVTEGGKAACAPGSASILIAAVALAVGLGSRGPRRRPVRRTARSSTSRAATCVRSRCRPTAAGCSPSTRPDNRLDDLRRERGRARRSPARCRSASSRSRSPRAANTEVWVVNHLSDSVSIVAIDAAIAALSRVTRTLLICDEPRDIVFAGPSGNRAFITTARRGQNCPVRAEPDHRRAGARASCRCFDADQPRRGARRHAAHDPRRSSATRRARWRARPTARGSSRRRSTRATARRRSPSPSVSGNGGAAAAAGGLHRRRAGDRPDRQVQRHDLGGRDQPRAGTARCRSPCPTATSSSSTPTRTRRP